MPIKTFNFQTKTPTTFCLSEYLLRAGWGVGHNGLSDIHFDFPKSIAETLEYKHLLAKFLEEQRFFFSPKTYYINDYNYSIVLEHIRKKDGPWILKPSLLNNGQSIRIFENAEKVVQHYQSSNRLGGPHVLQEYIDPPHLLQGPTLGHKYSIRMFLVLTMPFQAFLYPYGYFNIALKPYDKKIFASQVTNEHLVQDVYNVVQVPTFQYPFFETIRPKIFSMCQRLCGALKNLNDANDFQMAFFGLDFMLDANENLFLLEANHGPCFPIEDDHPLQKKLYEPFWKSIISEVIEPNYLSKRIVLKHWIRL